MPLPAQIRRAGLVRRYKVPGKVTVQLMEMSGAIIRGMILFPDIDPPGATVTKKTHEGDKHRSVIVFAALKSHVPILRPARFGFRHVR